jgi:hypothetical protein
MVPPSSPFTPAQLLDSARRCEAEGKLDLANQFYRHLMDHYANTPEAAEARNAMGRIGTVQFQAWQSGDTAAGAEAVPRPKRGARRRPVAPRDHYRTGRALAVCASGAGWLLAFLGLAAPIASIIPGTGLPQLELPQLVGAAVGLFAAGLLLVLLAQVAHALFDQASAARELVAMERAKLGQE